MSKFWTDIDILELQLLLKQSECSPRLGDSDKVIEQKRKKSKELTKWLDKRIKEIEGKSDV